MNEECTCDTVIESVLETMMLKYYAGHLYLNPGENLVEYFFLKRFWHLKIN